MLDTNRFEEFISQYPIYEYRVLDAAEIQVRELGAYHLQTGVRALRHHLGLSPCGRHP